MEKKARRKKENRKECSVKGGSDEVILKASVEGRQDKKKHSKENKLKTKEEDKHAFEFSANFINTF